MAVREILQIGNPVLRKRSTKIAHFDGALSGLVQDMLESMEAANGVGLAAPQIGPDLAAGAEGSVWLLLKGDKDQVEKALQIVEECREIEEGALF